MSKLMLPFIILIIISCNNVNLLNNNIIGLWTDIASDKGFGKTYRFYKDNTVQVKSSQLVKALPGEVASEKGIWELTNDRINCKIKEENIVVVNGGKPIEFEEGSWSDNIEEIKKTDKSLQLNIIKEEKGNTLYFIINDIKYIKISDDPFEP